MKMTDSLEQLVAGMSKADPSGAITVDAVAPPPCRANALTSLPARLGSLIYINLFSICT